MTEHKRITKTGCLCGWSGNTSRALSGHLVGHSVKAIGPANGRWNHGKIVTTDGYTAVRVDPSHPHAWGPEGSSHKYAYEHIIVAMEHVGRPLHSDELVHHENGDRGDNRWSNLVVQTRTDHAKHHARERGRDALGRFPPAP